MNKALPLILCTVCLILVSCAHPETTPLVTLKPNDSGLVCGEFVVKPAHYSLGEGWDSLTGKKYPPDVPPGVFAAVQRSNPIRVKGSRYMVSDSGRLAIVSVEQPQKYSTKWSDEVQELANLRTALNRGDVRALCTTSGGDEIPWMNASRCFHGKARIVQFPWGRAVMFLTTYVQGPMNEVPVNNDMLVLTVQGLTADGRYSVNGRFDIRHPRLPDTMDDRNAWGRRSFDLGDRKQLSAAEAWLDRQPDDAFQPGLGSMRSCSPRWK
jgi:hypothetical protein